LTPCLLLTSQASERVLGRALQLDVFSVIDKPVDMGVLRQQLNRLFLKKYNSDIFK
jgi:PleD family two-component response regulator